MKITDAKPPAVQNCACDGALDDGCYHCTPDKWKCKVCGFPIVQAADGSTRCLYCAGVRYGQPQWDAISFCGADVPAPPPSAIESFSREYRFLSNFWPVKVSFEGLLYPSSEHAFQAAKSENPMVRKLIADIVSPGDAKKAGRLVTLRPGWEEMKVGVMERILRVKFAPGSALAAMLLATGDRRLVEGNTWGDTFWGVCRGVGQNHLGELLMKVRAGLKAS